MIINIIIVSPTSGLTGLSHCLGYWARVTSHLGAAAPVIRVTRVSRELRWVGLRVINWNILLSREKYLVCVESRIVSNIIHIHFYISYTQFILVFRFSKYFLSSHISRGVKYNLMFRVFALIFISNILE